MSDITPADALRELGDDQAEYAAAAAKKLGLPESVEYVEMRTEYAVDFGPNRGAGRFRKANDKEDAVESAKYFRNPERRNPYPEARAVVHEVITTAWREVTP